MKSSTTRIRRSRRSNFCSTLGVDPKAVTTYNENALFGPGYRGWNRMLELLIEKGADVNIVNKAGVTPWLAASGFGDRLGGVLFNKAGADILLKHGADPKLGHPCQAQNSVARTCEISADANSKAETADADDGVRIDRARRGDLGDAVGEPGGNARVRPGRDAIRDGDDSRSRACRPRTA